MSSRLGSDQYGRQVVIVTTPGPVLDVGAIFLVLDGRPFGLVPDRGRLATVRERAAARPPYEAAGTRRERKRRQEEVPDELLAEQEAIRLARLEQQRQPVDLIAA